MIDGTYRIELQTPMGILQGQLVLRTKGQTLNGVLSLNNGSWPFSGGWAQGERCGFASRVQTPLGPLPLQVEGTVANGHFTAQVKTPFGPMKAVGQRMAGK